MLQETTTQQESERACQARGGLFCSFCTDIHGCIAEGACQKRVIMSTTVTKAD